MIYQLPKIGAGTTDDPFRPDLSGMEGITSYSVTSDNGDTFTVDVQISTEQIIIEQQAQIDALLTLLAQGEAP
jgi:hypothetical protein